MNSFSVFLRKELKEYIKTWKFLILVAVFFFSAITAPLLTKGLPLLYEAASSVEGFSDLLNIEALLSAIPVNMATSYSYYFANNVELSILVLIVIGGLAVVSEKKKGTAVLTLTKGISRTSFVLAKALSAVIWFLVAYVFSFLVFVVATNVMIEPCVTANAIIALVIFAVYCIFLVCVSIMASCIMKNSIMSMLVALGIHFLLTLVSSLPLIGKYLPTAIINSSNSILLSGFDSDLIIPLIVTVVLSFVALFIGINVFKKQEI